MSQEKDEEYGALNLVGCCCNIVPSGSVGTVLRFGKYVGYQEPGLMCCCWPIYSISSVSLAVRQMASNSTCKTKDNVTMNVKTCVVYRIEKSKLKAAVFDIHNPEVQISANVDDVLRSTLPTMDLDEAYGAKERVCDSILQSVRKSMAPYGYQIINVLITDLSPEASVLQAMNAINAARRQREAAVEQGEAQRILQVKAAEADAEAKFLSGQGVARMRKAVADGFKESMESMSQGGLSSQEAMHMMITTQYLDTLKDFANNPNAKSIMVPHGPGAVKDIEAQVRDGFMSSAMMQPGQQRM